MASAATCPSHPPGARRPSAERKRIPNQLRRIAAVTARDCAGDPVGLVESSALQLPSGLMHCPAQASVVASIPTCKLLPRLGQSAQGLCGGHRSQTPLQLQLNRQLAQLDPILGPIHIATYTRQPVLQTLRQQTLPAKGRSRKRVSASSSLRACRRNHAVRETRFGRAVRRPECCTCYLHR